MSTVPEKMKAVRIVKPLPTNFREAKDLASHVEIAEIPVPVPKENEVLIRVERTPINPSDMHGLTAPLPTPFLCGNEGSGVVVATGSNEQARAFMGKKVAFIAYARGSGAWAEYITVALPDVAVLPDDVTFEEGASALVNPWTVFAFVDVAKEGGHKSLLHTAAASHVGRMLNKYARRNGIEVINIVRKPEQKALLEELGAKYVIDTSDAKWQTQLQELCVKLDCKLGFDAIAGEMPGLLIKALRPGATLYLYGSLSCKPAGGFEVSDLLYGDKAIRAIAFSFHADKRGRDVVNREVLPRLKDDFKTTFAATFPLTKVTDAIASYIGNMNQKLCLAPHLSA